MTSWLKTGPRATRWPAFVARRTTLAAVHDERDRLAFYAPAWLSGAFDRHRQLAEPDLVTGSRAASAMLAENDVGLPFA